jgi:Uma2 family endonuclease
MSSVTASSALYDRAITEGTMAQIVADLGDVPLNRIRARPAPGTATEQDLISLAEKDGILCELVDGVLVEKPMGYYESRIAQVISHLLQTYLDQNPIAIVGGESGPMRTTGTQVRMPDVSVVLCKRFTLEMLKTQKVLPLAPDIAVEVLSQSNTRSEMDRKLREYFEAGTQLVWYIDPESETAEIFRSPADVDTISGDQEFTGGNVLPGFVVKLCEVFALAKGIVGQAAPDQSQ